MNKIFEGIATVCAGIAAAAVIIGVLIIQCVLAVIPVAIGIYVILWFLGKV